jgi:uncharacterized membrane protein YsdA (DUF1294 family)
MAWWSYSLIWLALINIIALAAMGYDKSLARGGHATLGHSTNGRRRTHARRVPERNLMLLALAGGSAGALLGLYLFRHKTRHRLFSVGLPLILVLQIALGVWLVLPLISK